MGSALQRGRHPAGPRAIFRGADRLAHELDLPIEVIGQPVPPKSDHWDAALEAARADLVALRNAIHVEVARRPHGLIFIANSDAAVSPHTDVAILEAHRAIEEVLEKRAYPFGAHGAAL